VQEDDMARPLISLIPSIEHRVHAWSAIHDHLAKQGELRVRPSVTLSRAFGCEGYAIAQRVQVLLAEATGEPWNVYDKALLEAVAKDGVVAMHTLKNLGETARSFERLGLRPPEYHQHAEAFRAVAEKLVHFATVGNAVVVGRGGAVLCRDLANCFHFRVEASFEWRVESMTSRLELSRPEAKALVESNTSLRDDFMQEQLHADLKDHTLYDAVFNNERAGVEAIAQAIAQMVRVGWKERAP
jgi:cytidylate kinase